MNYIKKLEAESLEYRKRIAETHKVIREFNIYLQSPKFQGVCENNIATHEVHAYLDRIGGILVSDPWYREENDG